MSSVFVITVDDILQGYFTSQEDAYNYILNEINKMQLGRGEDYSEDILELIESYNKFCEGYFEYFGTVDFNIFAERAGYMGK